MTDIVEEMVSVFKAAGRYDRDGWDDNEKVAMRNALMWLAANVSDEMLAAHAAADKGVTTANFRAGLAAALRAAAGEEGK
jgi:hypothetical protein